MESHYLSPIPPNDPLHPERKSRKKLYIGLGIAVGLLLLCGLITIAVTGAKLLWGAMKEPAAALTTYTDTLIKKDYQTAYNIASPAFRAAVSQQDLADYHARLTTRLGAIKSARQTNWEIETKNGVTKSTIQATLDFEHGSEPFEFVLIQEQGTWRVLSYKELSAAGVE